MGFYLLTNNTTNDNLILFDINYLDFNLSDFSYTYYDSITRDVINQLSAFDLEYKFKNRIYSYTKLKKILKTIYDFYTTNEKDDKYYELEYLFMKNKIADRSIVFQYYVNNMSVIEYYKDMSEYDELSVSCRNTAIQHATTIVRTYLDPPSQVMVFYIAKPLMDMYINQGIEGQNYGDIIDGIMDFIESTNSYSNTDPNNTNYLKGLLQLPLTFVNNKITNNQQLSDILKKILIFGEFVYI